MGNKVAIQLLFGASLFLSICAAGATAQSGIAINESRAAQEWLKPWTSLQHGACKNIQRARIFPVDEKFREEAIELLRDKSAVLLSTDQQEHLMGGTVMPRDKVVEQFNSDADAESRLSGAPPADQSIVYARTLDGKLKAYLVRAVTENPGTHAFSASWCGRDLQVSSGALGKVHYRRTPLIIYLEDAPSEVWINAMSAE